MGEIIFHFDREPIDEKIRVDYKWENNGVEYLIMNIPCIHFPLDSIAKNEEYLTTQVSEALSMLIYLAENDDEVPNVLDFTKVEGMLTHID